MEGSERDTLVERLRSVGLSRYEAAVYLGLLTDQRAKVAEISRRMGVPQPKVYQALEGLVEKGFCRAGTDLVNRYQAVPPEVALEGYLASLRKAEEQTLVLGRDLDAIFEEGKSQSPWTPPIEVVKGSKQVNRVAAESIAGAEKDIQFFRKAPLMRDAGIRAALERAAARGVQVRTVFERAFLEDPRVRGETGDRRVYGPDDRVVDELPTKMIIVDRRFALASISAARGEGFLAIVLRHKGLLEHCFASFEWHWQRGEPIVDPLASESSRR